MTDINKDFQFIDKLLESTGQGNVPWQATADDNQYAASFKGKWTVLVKEYHPPSGEWLWVVTIQDKDEREMLRIIDDEYRPVRHLYEAARRSALNVDEAIDDILKDLDDEIPF